MSLFGIGRCFYRPFNRRFSASYSFNALRSSYSGHRYNRNLLDTVKLRRRYGSIYGKN